MTEEINEDEVLSDSQSTPTTRSSSPTSADMPKSNLRLRPSGTEPSDSILKRQSSTIDINDLSSSLNKPQTPIKVLVFNGKCSKIFKSTLEDCVGECILEFPGENSIYVPKSGQAIQIPAGSNRNSIISLREQSAQESAKSNRRRSSNIHNSTTQIGSARTSLTTTFSLPATGIAATATTRIRHQLVQPKFSLAEDISEETSTIEPPSTTVIESKERSERPSLIPDESIYTAPNLKSSSTPLFPYHPNPSAKTHMSYRDRQKDYLLSDLVMYGPEYYAHVFNLPRSSRTTTPSRSRERFNNRQQRENNIADKYSELDQIKQDLFHRYLWTQKPQVSCRIRPLSTYARGATFVL